MLSTLDHAVEDDQELPHARGDGDFLGFAGSKHPLIELPAGLYAFQAA